MHADSSVLERIPEALAFSKSEAARMLGEPPDSRPADSPETSTCSPTRATRFNSAE
jgi:hypothetical protein